MHSYATDLERCRRERRAAIKLLHRYERATDLLLDAIANSEMSNEQAALDLLRVLRSER